MFTEYTVLFDAFKIVCTTPALHCIGAEGGILGIDDMLRNNMIAFQVAMRGFRYHLRIAVIYQSGLKINDEQGAPARLATSSWRGP
jgi:hypothetical protein